MTPIMWEDEERQRKILCKYAHMQLYFLELCFVKGLRIIVLFRLVHYPLHIPCLVKSNVFMQPYHNILTAGFCALHALWNLCVSAAVLSVLRLDFGVSLGTWPFYRFRKRILDCVCNKFPMSSIHSPCVQLPLKLVCVLWFTLRLYSFFPIQYHVIFLKQS